MANKSNKKLDQPSDEELKETLKAAKETELENEKNQPTSEEEKLKEEVSSLKDQLLRSIADQENLRKRAEREKIDMAKYAITNFAKDLITIADTFERALSSVSEKDLLDNPTAKALTDGIRLTETELLRVLERVGVKKNEPTIGDKFDPNFHQAMFELDHEDIPKGHIAQVMQIGYTHHNRLLRPAMVGISKGKEKT